MIGGQPKMETKTIKILKENKGKYFYDLGVGKYFLAWHKKYLTNLTSIKLKTLSKVKWQFTDWKKIFTIQSDKVLISKIYKELL